MSTPLRKALEELIVNFRMTDAEDARAVLIATILGEIAAQLEVLNHHLYETKPALLSLPKEINKIKCMMEGE
jgi:hypothetical protein